MKNLRKDIRNVAVHRWVVLAISAGSVAAVAVAVWPRSAATPPEAEQEQQPGPLEKAKGQLSLPDSWTVHVDQSGLPGLHHVTFSTEVSSGERPEVAPARWALAVDLSLVRAQVQGTTWLLGRLEDAKLTVEVAKGSDFTSRVPAAGMDGAGLSGAGLNGSIAVREQADGSLGEVRFDSKIPSEMRATLVSMLQTAQVVAAPDPAMQTWQADETGVNTSYKASYQRTADGLDKTWVTQDGEDSQGLPAGYAESGRTQFRLAGKQVEHIGAQVTGQITWHNTAHPAMQFVLAAQWQRKGPAAADLAAAVPLNLLESFDRDQYASGWKRKNKRKALSPQALDQLINKTASVAAHGKWQDRHALGTRLAGEVVADPAAARTIAKRIRSEDHEPTRRTLLEALAAAGTPVAQHELTDIAADQSAADDLRIQAYGAATFIRKPTAEFLAALESSAYSSEAKALPDAAVVALSAAIRHDLDSSAAATSATAARFAAAAANRLGQVPKVVVPTGTASQVPDRQRETSDPATPTSGVVTHPPIAHLPASGRTRREWTRALGNAALESTVPTLQALFADPDQHVRAAAAFSTRFFDATPLLGGLTTLMETDDSILVRSAVAEACEYLGPQHCEALVTRAIVHDDSEMVRQAAAYTVTRWSVDKPDYTSILTEALKVEKSDKVRQVLMNYLKPGRAVYPFRLAGKAAGGTKP